MANRYFLNIGVNYNDTANWSDTSGGAGGFSVPTNADDVFFNASSGNCTVNVASVAKTITFTGYTNTITMSNTLTVSGNVTLGASMGVAGSSALIVNATATLTSNAKTWSAGFTFSGTSITYTLADNWTISGALSLSGTTATTINGNTIFSSGNLTSTSTAITSGTTAIQLTGGTWSNSSSGALRNNLTINGNVTVSGTVYYNTGTLTYTSGTVTTTSSTLTIGASTTLNTNGITWNNITIPSTSTITLTSNLLANGLYNVGNSANSTVNSTTTETMTIGGGVTVGSNSSLIGTAKLITTGGTVSTSGVTVGISKDWDIQGNVTMGSSVYFNGKVGGSALTLKYVSGTVTTTSSTLVIAYNGSSTTLDTSGIAWNNVTIGVTTNTTTLASDLTVNGLLTISGATTFNGTFNTNVSGGITMSNTLSQGTGTTTLNLLGGTWSGSSALRINTVINGNVTVSGSVAYNTGTLTYTSGTVTTTGSTLTIGASTTLNTNGMSWNNIISNSTLTLTMGSNLTMLGLLTTNSGVLSLSGNYNFYISGGITLNTSIQVGTGTPKIVLQGGTWAGANSTTYIRTNMDLNGNITMGAEVSYSTNTLTYVSGTITPGTVLYINASCTLNTNGMSWNNITVSGAITITNNSQLTINGTLSVADTTINGSDVNCKGNLTITASMTGTPTAKIVFNGTGNQVWSGNFELKNSIDIDKSISGNFTINSSVIYSTGTLTYLSGSYDLTGSTLTVFRHTTFNTSTLVWNNITVNNWTVTNNSTFIVGGTLNLNNCTINGSDVYCKGDLTMSASMTGTPNATIVINGSGNQTWSGNFVLRNNLTINNSGTLTVSGTVAYNTGTLTYISGRIIGINTPALTVGASSTFIGIHKILVFKTVTITAGTTQTFDSFFNGSATELVTVQSSSTTSNYTVAFQDTFEKVTKFTKISNCTLARPLQLLVLNQNSNKGGNIGLRYVNSLPNRVPRNMATVNNQGPMVGSVLAGDPNMITN